MAPTRNFDGHRYYYADVGMKSDMNYLAKQLRAKGIKCRVVPDAGTEDWRLYTSKDPKYLRNAARRTR